MNAETLIVKRTCKFRLITPNTVAGAAQRAMFAQLTGASRVVWNAGVAYLNDRQKHPEKYDDGKKRVYAGTAGVGTRAVALPRVREERPWFASLERTGCNHILRHPLERLDDSLSAAFGRLNAIKAQRAAGIKTRKKAGFPKFHAKREDESFTVPDGFKNPRPDGKHDLVPIRISESRKRILLPGVLNRLPRGGRVPKNPPDNAPNIGWIRLNRKVPENALVKCVVVKRDGRKWFAFLQCEVAIPAPRPHSGPDIGLDMNVEERAQIAASDGRMFPAALGENEFADLKRSKARAETRRKRYERRMSRLRDIALRERGEWNGKNTARKAAEKRLKDSHMAEIEARRKHREVVADPYYCVLPETLEKACEKAGLPADRLKSAGVLHLLADRKAPTRKFFAENIADAVPGISLPQWRRAKTALDEILPRSHRIVVAGPYCVLPGTLAKACKKAGLSADQLESAGVLKLLADRKSPTRKFFAENIAESVPGVSLPQWRRAKTALDEILPRNKRRQKFGESKYGVRYQMSRTRKRHAAAKTKNIRDNFGHRVSARLARECGLVGAEALRLPDMTASAKGTKKNPGKNVRAKAGMNREMLDKSFGGLRNKIKYKAEAQGGRFHETPYAYTSQACNRCGGVDPENRKATARFKCVHCGHEDDAQTNAAKNVLAVALKIQADPEAAESVPAGPSDKTKKFVVLAIKQFSAHGDGAARPATGAQDNVVRKRTKTARSGGEGVRKAAKAAAEQSAGSLPPKSPRGNMREITPAKARNRATKPKKESGLFPDSPEKPRRCAGKGGPTP